MTDAGNNTSCSPYGNCTIIEGAITNGTMFVAPYDPNAPGPRWRKHMEMATICVCNSLTLIVIIARIWYRWRKLRRFRADDKWIAVAGFFLLFYWASLIGTNVYGSGLHFENVPMDWRPMHWHFTTGWVGYYIVATCIKISVCCCFLEILPQHLKALRYGTYALCILISSLGITLTCLWLFGCEPFVSNFLWSVLSTECLNPDIIRWLWVGVSIPIDAILVVIPLQILKRAKLRSHERRILKLVFSATLLGTITCTTGIYGIYEYRLETANDSYYHEVVFLMMGTIEIFMYALGASFPVLSRYIVKHADRGPHDSSHQNFSSWARYIPDFFLSNISPASRAKSEVAPNTVPEKSLHDENDNVDADGDAYSGVGASDASDRHMIATPSATSSHMEIDIHGDGREREKNGQERDIEKGEIREEVREVSVKSNRNTDESILREYIQSSQVIGRGW